MMDASRFLWSATGHNTAGWRRGEGVFWDCSLVGDGIGIRQHERAPRIVPKVITPTTGVSGTNGLSFRPEQRLPIPVPRGEVEEPSLGFHLRSIAKGA